MTITPANNTFSAYLTVAWLGSNETADINGLCKGSKHCHVVGKNIVLTSKCKGIAGERCGHKGHEHRAVMNCRLGTAEGRGPAGGAVEQGREGERGGEERGCNQADHVASILGLCGAVCRKKGLHSLCADLNPAAIAITRSACWATALTHLCLPDLAPLPPSLCSVCLSYPLPPSTLSLPPSLSDLD